MELLVLHTYMTFQRVIVCRLHSERIRLLYVCVVSCRVCLADDVLINEHYTTALWMNVSIWLIIENP